MNNMDAVEAFSTEMMAMMDMKPPISRAKMLSITKAGLKAIKLYKHVVQIVEKFIKKCNPELKVPGLYVVDSVIRQSRHQFGADKDVFAPRFLRNMTSTFQSLYQCPPDDKEKILRVLNLWVKNSVFSMDVIQPLVDMASAPTMPVLENGGSSQTTSLQQPTSSEPLQPAAQLALVSQFLQSNQSLDLQRILQTLQRTSGGQASEYNEQPAMLTNPPVQHQDLQHHLLTHQPRPTGEQSEQGVADRSSSSRDAPAMRRSRSRSPRSRSSSRSRSTSHNSRRRRSRSGERWRASPRSHRQECREGAGRSAESRAEERGEQGRSPKSHEEEMREMMRRRNGLPPVKRETLSVCSTTLWVGQLDKKTQKQDITSLMEEFGQIVSVNMIPPRGCAYVVLVHRRDAHTALNKLAQSSARITRRPFKIAWAMNKGVGSRYKKYWDGELGVTYVPWIKLKDSDLVDLKEGALLDPETLKPGTEWAAPGQADSDAGTGAELELKDGAPVTPQIPDGGTSEDFSGAEVTCPSEEPWNQTGTLNDPQPPFLPPRLNLTPRPSAPSPNISGPNVLHPVRTCTDIPQHQLQHPVMPQSSMPRPTMPGPNMPRPSMPHSNMLHPNMPRPRIPRPIMPCPSISSNNMPHPGRPSPSFFRGPMFGGRMRTPGPNGERFSPPGPREAERWEGLNLGNDWGDDGPTMPPTVGHWNRGGSQGRGSFRNGF